MRGGRSKLRKLKLLLCINILYFFQNILEKLSKNSFKPLNQTDNCIDSNLGLLATNSNKSFCIFTKLRELYLEECGKEFDAHMNVRY